MTTPIVTETSRNGNPVGRPTLNGPSTPIPMPPDDAW